MAKKFFIFVFFIFSSVNLFSIAPTAKNANKANRYFATMKRIEDNTEDFKKAEDFFALGRVMHFVEVLKPVFEDLYDNGVAGISLKDVEYLNSEYEDFLLKIKPVFEMMFYNFDQFIIKTIIFDEIKKDLPNELKRLSDDKLMKLSLREFNRIGSSSKESFDEISELDFDKIKKVLPKYKNLSYNEFMNLSMREFFRMDLEASAGFEIEEVKAEYERGLSYDKIEFD